MLEAGDMVNYRRFIPENPGSPETRVCEVVEWSNVVEDCIVIKWSADELLTVDYRVVEKV